MSSLEQHFSMPSNDAMIVRQLFTKSTNSVLPHVRLKQMLQFDGKNLLKIEGGPEFTLPRDGCVVVGFGKAVVGMAAELQRILKLENIRKMTLSVPHGICDQLTAAGQQIQLPKPDPGLVLIEGAKGNIPDASSLKASKMISESVSNLSNNDLVIVLVTGGGSALLPAPKPPLSLDDKAKLTSELSKAGASIQELNAVRIQLSELKGGKLAKKAKPAQVLGLILSDIIGDPLELISSGPTICSKNSSFNNVSALDILDKYNVNPQNCVKEALKATSTIVDPDSNENVINVLIGNNSVALETCRENACLEGFDAHVISNELDGEAKIVGQCFGTLAFLASHQPSNNSATPEIETLLETLKIKDKNLMKTIIDAIKKHQNQGQPLCLISGGETTVKVRGTGRGGRNQEMVLAAMIKYNELVSNPEGGNLCRKSNVSFLSAGTDGIDGPTDAAGALAQHDMCLEARKQGLDPYEFLHNNDSYSFFKYLNNGKNLVMTGHTGTNVMDLQILLIHPIS